MEIIIAAVVSIATQIFKKLTARFGYEITKNAIVILVFLLAIVGAVLRMQGVISPEMIRKAMEIGAMAIAMYEVIWKRILKPILEK